MSDAKTVRQQLHEAIQSTIPEVEAEESENSLPEGAMLMGWVTVVEWMAPDGDRWLSKVSGTASGEGAAAWQEQGYLHNALFDPDFG